MFLKVDRIIVKEEEMSVEELKEKCLDIVLTDKKLDVIDVITINEIIEKAYQLGKSENRLEELCPIELTAIWNEISDDPVPCEFIVEVCSRFGRKVVSKDKAIKELENHKQNISPRDEELLDAIDLAIDALGRKEVDRELMLTYSAQGYCTERNEKKIVDPELLEDVVDAIITNCLE